MINIRVKYWQHEGDDTNFSRNIREFGVPDSRPRASPNSSALRYGLQPGDLESIDIEIGEAGPSNYQERASSRRVSVTEDAVAIAMAITSLPPSNVPEADPDDDEEAAEDKVKAEAEKNCSWLESASIDLTVSLDEIDVRADNVY